MSTTTGVHFHVYVNSYEDVMEVPLGAVLLAA